MNSPMRDTESLQSLETLRLHFETGMRQSIPISPRVFAGTA